MINFRVLLLLFLFVFPLISVYGERCQASKLKFFKSMDSEDNNSSPLDTSVSSENASYPELSFKAESQRAGSVEQVLIHLHNVEHGLRTIPGSDGIVSLERRRYREMAQTLDAMATFYDVPARRGYTVTGRHRSGSRAFDRPLELWGIWEDVEISQQENEFTFVRKMPYILDVRAHYERSNLANPSLEKGEELTFDVIFRNPSDETYKALIVMLLINQTTGEITRLEKDYIMHANSRRSSASMSFTPPRAGEYHFAAGIFVRERINQWTDCWDWSPNPLFFVTREHRTLEFAGYTWDVKAGFGNPGNNLWSNDTSDVWVDEDGRLNLTLSKKDNGRWYATEVISHDLFDYGTFTFFLDAEPANYDPHVVAGIFLYKNEENEIDIEFSRWGDAENYQFGNYVIQPAEVPGNQFRFPFVTTGTFTTHRIVWKHDEILFSSWHGHWDEPPEDRIIAQWQYTGRNIPSSGMLRLFFNIWLFRGIAPQKDTTETLVVSDFTYKPLMEEAEEMKEEQPY